jgi:hypothetical protein
MNKKYYKVTQKSFLQNKISLEGEVQGQQNNRHDTYIRQWLD